VSCGDLAINLSAQQMSDPSFAAACLDTFARAGVGLESITFEVTETVLVTDHTIVQANMRRLRPEGARFSIDDFGTGYSSLLYLKELPIDQLKIDREFVAAMLNSRDDIEIVKAIVDLARNLELEVVTEGVETAAQASMLERLGCTQAQGYLYGRPAPAESISERLRAAAAGAVDC
jgi:EAL domain-containing protein (putative c-di-GMP-specific phosphodiesterase class I)